MLSPVGEADELEGGATRTAEVGATQALEAAEERLGAEIVEQRDLLGQLSNTSASGSCASTRRPSSST